MEPISIVLIVVFFIILIIPTSYDLKLYQSTLTCEKHKWVYKDSGIEDNKYLVCDICGKLPGNDNKEEKHEE